MNVKREHKNQKGAFFVQQDGERIAEMTYVMTGQDKFIIDHTDVSDRVRGQGVGRELVENAVFYARSQNYKIMPLCPFARQIFKKTPDFRDVLFP